MNKHIYDYAFDPESECTGAYIVNFVGKDKNVLEIGAGPGSITRVLNNNNNCKITAIDIVPDHIDRLMEYCDAVHLADLNDVQWPKIIGTDEKFDVILAGDVLEHLIDPLTCLRNMVSLLNDDGSIVISIPHIGHAVIAACLWDEDFEYRDWGLLDRTHLRFFGIKNIQQLVDNAGLKIVGLKFTMLHPEQTELKEHWNKLNDNLKKELLANRFSCVYQVVFKAKPLKAAELAISLENAELPKLNFKELSNVDENKNNSINNNLMQKVIKWFK